MPSRLNPENFMSLGLLVAEQSASISRGPYLSHGEGSLLQILTGHSLQGLPPIDYKILLANLLWV